MERPPSGQVPPSHHARVKQVFLDALDAERSERVAYVARACAGDKELWREVLELLLLHGEADSLLDVPLDGASVLAGLAEPAVGSLGPFRLVRELGRGGMGIVHLAEKDGRTYAVKLLAAGSLSPELRERFRLEAEILQRLDHDGIARVVDVGEVPGAGGVSQPWIAMEHVEGVPLHEHVERAGLGLDDRLRLLATVCRAVQHAHSLGVVHRDLKPANILVRPDGRPVVLDFGVARLTSGDERPTELLTRTGQLLGTPQYMSPEQVQGDPAGITPASDVYSLGVIAYELCAGKLPYEASSVSLHRAVMIILTAEPPPLGSVDRRFRGALERIAMKALAKDRARRYRDAGELADDLERKLSGQPVSAPGPSFLEWLLRRVMRVPRAMRRTAAIVLLLGVAGLIWYVAASRGRVPRERILGTYREAEGLAMQAVPFLYEGERTPSRLRQAIDMYSRARFLLGQVPPLRHHDPLLRSIEKDLGTSQFLLGELTWDMQPYRASALTLLHATGVSADTIPGWRDDVQADPAPDFRVPQRDLYGLLAAAYLGQYRLWGESGAALNALSWVRMSRAEIQRLWGPPQPDEHPSHATPEGEYAYAYLFNSLTEVTDEAARFRADTAFARGAVLYSDSAMARRSAFLKNWPALGSLLFERGRALRTLGGLTRSAVLLDSSARYLNECADYRGPERPWVFVQTRQELANLALDQARMSSDVARRESLLRTARRDVEAALLALRGTELPPAAAASLRSLDAELLAELAIAARRPALLEEAAARLREASAVFPSTALPREAAWVCVRQSVLARARFLTTGDAGELEAASPAHDRAQVLFESHSESLVLFRVRAEREVLARARRTGPS